tara:strand:+ start:422 stop:643 length:222 start_codon:yes stop_codon:yes gene_type:complete
MFNTFFNPKRAHIMAANGELIEAMKQDQTKIAAQLITSNPQWQKLQGAIEALEGKYQLADEANNELDQESIKE